MNRDFEHTIVPPELLGDVADDARIERGWLRLQDDLEFSTADQDDRRRSRHSGGHFPRWAFAAAAGVACFYAGWQLAPRQTTGPVTLAPAVDDHTRNTPRPSLDAVGNVAVGPPSGIGPAQQERPARRPLNEPSPPRSDTPSSVGSATVHAVAPWMTACDQGDFARAVELFEATGSASGDVAHTPAQLMCLSSGNETHGKSLAAIAVLERVIRAHPDDPYAVAAASNLARIHQAAGDDTKARHYRQLAQKLSKGSLLSEAALCNKIREAADAKLGAPLRRLSERYETQFPHGPCSENIARWLLQQERRDKQQAAEEAKRADDPADAAPPEEAAPGASAAAPGEDAAPDPYADTDDDESPDETPTPVSDD